MNLNIPHSIYEKILAQVLTERPHECCGLLGGSASPNQMFAQNYYPLRNQAAQPETQFFAAPQDLFSAMKVMRLQQEKLLAIYHSHPQGPSHPSQTDLAMAFYPEALLLIITLVPQQTMRAFQINGGKIIEVKITVIP